MYLFTTDVATQRKEQNVLDQRITAAETDITSVVQKQGEVQASVSGMELGKLVNILCCMYSVMLAIKIVSKYHTCSRVILC